MAAFSYNTYKKYRAAARQRYTGKDETNTGVLVTERENFMADDWKQAWQPMINAVGTDFSDGAEVQGADEVERGAIRRFLEPLEFDCPLHYDRAVATAYGYSDILAPYSSIMTWTIPPLWYPGTHIFTSAERNSQPAHNPLSGVRTSLAPPTTGFFATDIEIDYLKPVVASDRLARVGWKLISCAPKETSVGRGAFMTWESEVRNQRGDIVARTRTSTYSYNPHASQSEG